MHHLSKLIGAHLVGTDVGNGGRIGARMHIEVDQADENNVSIDRVETHNRRPGGKGEWGAAYEKTVR